jgi:phosphohistidine phosphatase SixA
MKRIIAVFVLLLVPSAALAQGSVLIVRHAERADAGMASQTDPDLSDAGRARAEVLAAILADAGITAIYVTEFKRTQQTAAPLAKRLGIEPVIVSAKDPAGLAVRIGQTAGHVLVVGHSNTLPQIVKALGVPDAITIADSEFDNLLVVSRSATPSVVRLRYR